MAQSFQFKMWQGAAILSLLWSSLSAQTSVPVKGVTEGSSPVPVIVFEQTFFDFGKVQHEQTVAHRFKFSNAGTSALHVLEVQTSCGCTSTLVGKMILAPGESTEIAATFTPENSSGLVHKAIRVSSDDPVHPTVELHFKADVLPAPPSGKPTLSFHNVYRTAQRRDSVRLIVPVGQNLTAIHLGDAAYLSVYPTSDAEGTTLEIVLDGAKLPTDAMSGQNILTVSTDGNSTIPVTVNWDARPVIEAAPAILSLEKSSADSARGVTVTLRHLGKKDFKILRATTTNPAIQVSLPDRPAGAVQDFQVSLASGAPPGDYPKEQVVLELDDVQQPFISLPVSAVIKD